MLLMTPINVHARTRAYGPAALALLSLALSLAATVSAHAATITTYAGGGTNGNFSNTIGFPATNANFNANQTSIQGLAVDLLGNLYLASFNGHQVLRVDPANGFITSFAGSGVSGHSGDGGPATDAQFNSPQAVAVDLAGNVFVLDQQDNLVRKIDAATGIITTVAGRYPSAGYGGNGGPATNASLFLPQGIAVDVHGNLYIADTFNFEVRKVDAATGVIHAIAGRFPSPGYTGDGGPSTNALLSAPYRVAVDASGNLFILDGGPTRVRRIDGQTGIITTVAGGGTGDGASGSATNASLDLNLFGSANDFAVDNLGSLFIAGWSQVWKVDLASEKISIIVGRGGTSMGFSGDGGPATNAELNTVFGLAVAGTGDLYLTDYGNERVRRVTPDAVPPFDVVIDSSTTQTFLNLLTAVQGSVVMTDVKGRNSLVIPNLTATGGSVIVTGNDSATTLTIPMLNSVGGGITISNNSSLAGVPLGSVANVGGNITVSGNDGAPITIDSPTVRGGLTLTTSSGSVSLGSPSAGGDLTITTGTGTVNLGSPTNSGNLTLTTSSGSISLGSANVRSNLDISTSTGTVSLGSPNVSGNLMVTTSSGSLDVSGAHVSGNTIVTTTGSSNVTLSTALGSTSVTLSNGAATMQAVLPAGTFRSNVVFSVSTVPPATLPTFGTMSNVTSSVISAVGAYHFTFAIPTLNQDAALTFNIQLSALDPTNRAAFLDALNAGAATVAVIGDAPGSVLQVFPVCGLGIAPSAGGCVSVTKLDATSTPLPDGSLAEPASVRFSGVAGHFSTWAVVLAKPLRVTTTLLGNGQLRLAWPDVSGGVLETSTNLAPNSWSPAGSPTRQPDGSWQLEVFPGEPQRFYRLKAQ